MRTVATKRHALEKHLADAGKLRRYLEKRPIPAIRGPGQRLFMVDHHHLGYALCSAGVSRAVVLLIDDQSHRRGDDFWSWMLAAGALHPYDADGQPIPLTGLARKLPKQLLALANDPYRDLATAVRRAGGFAKSTLPFSEFSWANYFRTHIAPERLQTGFREAVVEACRLAGRREASALPGFVARRATSRCP